VAIVILFVLIGWLTFTNEPGRSSINIETNEIRQDTGEAMRKGSELLRDAEEKVAPERAEEPAPPSVRTP
jgi:hypothetical protein